MSALDKQVGGSHYRQGTIQPVQYIESNKLGFLEGSVLKRITRHDKEGGKGRQDIEKAIHELQLMLELRYPPSETRTSYSPAVPFLCELCDCFPCECVEGVTSRTPHDPYGRT